MLSWTQKFINGMFALGLDYTDADDVASYLQDSPVARKKGRLAYEEQDWKCIAINDVAKELLWLD